jgi:hypothetical protein
MFISVASYRNVSQKTRRSPNQSIRKDLGRPWLEACVPKVAALLAEVQHALCNLNIWMIEESKPVPVILLDSKVSVRKDPFGVVFFISLDQRSGYKSATSKHKSEVIHETYLYVGTLPTQSFSRILSTQSFSASFFAKN